MRPCSDPPHVDIYVYAPGALLPGWALVTAGRASARVVGQRVELVMHLRPEEGEYAVEDGITAIRRTALLLGKDTPDWTFKALEDERLQALSKRLPLHPTFLQAIYRQPAR